MRFAGKVIIISGAAGGIGSSTAEIFAREGGTVLLGDLHPAGCETLVDTFPTAEYRKLDVSSEDDWTSLVDHALERHGAVDVVVNNAGILAHAMIEDCTAETFTESFRVNQLGVLLGMKAALRAMKHRGGAIVNVSSAAGLLGVENSIAYGSTKWAVRGMTKVAALEFARHGIRVNSVHPGLIETGMTTTGPGVEAYRELGRTTVFGRVGKPAEVGKLIAFLASEQASFCSGGEYAVDGALSAGIRRP